MGLFGPKISKEEKNLQAAYKKAFRKPTIANIQALKSAVSTCPNQWQCYWLCAIHHDFGCDNTPVDEGKAQEYFLQAEHAVQGTEHENWFNTFMLWYRRDAGNLLKSLDETQNKLRRLGVALCHCMTIDDGALTRWIEKYGADGYNLISLMEFISSCDAERMPFYHFTTVATFDHNEQRKHTKNFYDNVCDSASAFSACIKEKTSGKAPHWENVQDMFYYLLGVNCIDGGDLLTGELADELSQSETALGIESYIHAAEMGCQSAVHDLVRLANASQNNFDLMERIYRSTIHLSDSPFELFLLEQIEKCVRKKDEEAMRLFQMYYAARFAGNH